MDLADGVLFFPVTPFSTDGDVDLGVLGQHLAIGLSNRPGAVFVACGTGEFHALGVDEYSDVVRTAISVVGGRVPVFAGTGGSLGNAVIMARAAEHEGADGLLVMPPYLVRGSPQGLVSYAECIARQTDLPLVIYNRGTAIFDPASAVRASRIPTVVGLKDGHGDLGLLSEIIEAISNDRPPDREPLIYFNGMPTAETSMPEYLTLGITRYSSAVFAFAPQIANAYRSALLASDSVAVQKLIDGFFAPFATLRDQLPGGAISLVKAGVRLQGLQVGAVRPPLLDPSEEQVAALTDLVRAGGGLLAQLPMSAGTVDEPAGGVTYIPKPV